MHPISTQSGPNGQEIARGPAEFETLSPPRPGPSAIRLAGLYALFFLIAWGLGYPTLNRYDPRQVSGLADVKTYADMVTGNPVPRLEHMRYRVLVPWMARPFYHLADHRIASWDPVIFSLLVANSLFIAGTALLIVVIGTRILSYPASLIASLLYLVNFAVPNLRLVGLVDAGEAFFLLALYWILLHEQLWLIPAVAVFGAMAKESFIPFSIVFTAAWWLVVRKELAAPRRASLWIGAGWIVTGWIVGLAALFTLHRGIGGHWDNPLAFAEELRGNNHYLMNLWSSVWDRNFWYVFVWLLPLGIPKLKRLPRSWLIPTAAVTVMAFVLDTYYTGAYGTSARALFSTAGPLLALSSACLLLGTEPGVGLRK